MGAPTPRRSPKRHTCAARPVPRTSSDQARELPRGSFSGRPQKFRKEATSELSLPHRPNWKRCHCETHQVASWGYPRSSRAGNIKLSQRTSHEDQKRGELQGPECNRAQDDLEANVPLKFVERNVCLEGMKNHHLVCVSIINQPSGLITFMERRKRKLYSLRESGCGLLRPPETSQPSRLSGRLFSNCPGPFVPLSSGCPNCSCPRGPSSPLKERKTKILWASCSEAWPLPGKTPTEQCCRVRSTCALRSGWVRGKHVLGPGTRLSRSSLIVFTLKKTNQNKKCIQAEWM
ncbi:uncharacterized protein LOC104850341 [Fukomys damarensis]|uniref:uncharacterized protein LOC104850341 n=1 Tax=Fukomys damarensis TaxID=885580 RepID=UPI00053F91C5|nr:uncharacterized protein LOC104850341 [Fukomys damarensis]